MNHRPRRWPRPRFSLGAALVLAGMIAAFLGGWTSHRRELQSQYTRDLQTARDVRGRIPTLQIVVIKAPGTFGRVMFKVPSQVDPLHRIDEGMGFDRIEHEMRMQQFEGELRSLRMEP